MRPPCFEIKVTSDTSPVTASQPHPPSLLVSCPSPVPANIYKVSEDITVNEGSNVTLSCLASGRPDPAITWRLLNPSGEAADGAGLSCAGRPLPPLPRSLFQRAPKISFFHSGIILRNKSFRAVLIRPRKVCVVSALNLGR